MTPSWPQLVGWMATPEARTLRCSWREQDGRRGQSGSAVLDLQADLAQVLDAQGRLLPHSGPQRLLVPGRFTRGDDYHVPAGPVTIAEHDGRPCWRVDLLPPARKKGLLTLLVDDATGMCLHQGNSDHDVLLEVTGLEVDVALPEDAFDLTRAEQERASRDSALYALVHQRPPPTPRWFPWRRGYLDTPDCWVVEGGSESGVVARAPLGRTPQLPEWEWDEHDVVRLDHGGWSWAVGARPRLDDAVARDVVEQVLDGRPYD